MYPERHHGATIKVIHLTRLQFRQRGRFYVIGHKNPFRGYSKSSQIEDFSGPQQWNKLRR